MRLQVSRMTDLGVRALLAMGARGDRTPGAELVDVLDTSPGVLPQVMAPLVQAGWVTSTTGPGGGYDLVVPLAELSLRTVTEAIEGPIETGRCVLADHDCPSPNPCPLHDAWVSARSALVRHLEATSLASLHAPVTPSGPPAST